MDMNKQVLAANTLLDDRYIIKHRLGQGGMAQVYLAEDSLNNCEVAIKVMRDELTQDHEFIRRFAFEARSAASLKHPNIVKVLDYGQDQGIRYIVQEYIEGTTLKDLIKDKGRLDYRLACSLMLQIALAIEHAHQAGVIHRDLKPQNVLITPDLKAKVADFGMAQASHTSTITLTGGMAFGSVHYFSPEQAKGGEVSEKSDLYSLGIILYEMVTGLMPFDGESPVAVAIKQLQLMPKKATAIIPDLPVALDSIIHKSIQKNPLNRYDSASELIKDLDGFLQNPAGAYGQINTQNTKDIWEAGSTAIAVQKDSSDFSKISDIEKNISKRKRSRYRDTAIIAAIVLTVIAIVSMLIVWIYQEITGKAKPVKSDEFRVENYVGRSIEEVRQELLDKYKIEPDIKYQEHKTVKNGFIFEQDPVAGMTLKLNNAKVKLVVSSGKDALTVPADIIGQSIELVKEKLQAMGLEVIESKEASSVHAIGLVTRTMPAVNSSIGKGEKIWVYVSQGQKNLTMIKIEGLSWTDAKARLQNMGLTLFAQQSIATNDKGDPIEVEEGQRVIVEQMVKPGEAVKAGSSVPVKYGTHKDYMNKVSPTSPTKVERVMEKFVGQRWDQVQATMSKWDGVTEVFVSRTVNGLADSEYYVLEQNVDPGTKFIARETKFVFSLGTKKDYDDSLTTTTTTTTTTTPPTTTSTTTTPSTTETTTTTTSSETTTTTTTESP